MLQAGLVLAWTLLEPQPRFLGKSAWNLVSNIFSECFYLGGFTPFKAPGIININSVGNKGSKPCFPSVSVGVIYTNKCR